MDLWLVGPVDINTVGAGIVGTDRWISNVTLKGLINIDLNHSILNWTGRWWPLVATCLVMISPHCFDRLKSKKFWKQIFLKKTRIWSINRGDVYVHLYTSLSISLFSIWIWIVGGVWIFKPLLIWSKTSFHNMWHPCRCEGGLLQWPFSHISSSGGCLCPSTFPHSTTSISILMSSSYTSLLIFHGCFSSFQWKIHH